MFLNEVLSHSRTVLALHDSVCGILDSYSGAFSSRTPDIAFITDVRNLPLILREAPAIETISEAHWESVMGEWVRDCPSWEIYIANLIGKMGNSEDIQKWVWEKAAELSHALDFKLIQCPQTAFEDLRHMVMITVLGRFLFPTQLALCP